MRLTWDFKNQFVPTWIIFNIDFCICLISLFITFLLTYNFIVPFDYRDNMGMLILLILMVRSIGFLTFGIHKQIVRQTSNSDFTKLLIVQFIGSILLLIINLSNKYFLGGTLIVSFSVLIMEFIISTYFLIFFRICIKYLFSSWKPIQTNFKPVLIYGSHEEAVLVKKTIDYSSESNYKVVGFIDNNKNAHHKKLVGLPVFELDCLAEIVQKFNINNLIIADNTISGSQKKEIIELCLNCDIKVFIKPKLINWVNANQGISNKITEVKIEDLLDRDPITINNVKIGDEIKGKTILITGAAGSIGSELFRQIMQFNPRKLILLDQAETPLNEVELEIRSNFPDKKIKTVIADITNYQKLSKVFSSNKIDIVFHAAAYKHVPMMEKHPDEAVINNIFGTKNLADLAIIHSVKKFVMVSTDKAVNPTSVMGATKRIAEVYTQSLNHLCITSFITTRFGNVLDSNGSVIPLFKKQIAAGGPITVTHPEITRFFMTIPEACQLVLEASVMGKGGEIFLFDMGKSVKIADLAKNMIKLANLNEENIKIKYIGMRPGEKLYEELLVDGENFLPTYHPKIVVAKVNVYEFNIVTNFIQRLKEASEQNDVTELVEIMKEMLPEYKSMNSVFENLDLNHQSKNIFK